VGGIAGALVAGPAATVQTVEQAEEAKKTGENLIVVMKLGAVGGFAAQVLLIVGYGRCMGAPARNGSKGLAMAAAGLAIMALILQVPGMISTIASGPGPNQARQFQIEDEVFNAPNLLGSLAALSAQVCFLFFLRAIALTTRNSGLARSTEFLIVIGAVMAVLMVVILMQLSQTSNQLAAAPARAQGMAGQGGGDTIPSLALGLGCFEAVLALVWALWFIVTLFHAHETVTRSLDGGA
jgi:hypothetical protein